MRDFPNRGACGPPAGSVLIVARGLAVALNCRSAVHRFRAPFPHFPGLFSDNRAGLFHDGYSTRRALAAGAMSHLLKDVAIVLSRNLYLVDYFLHFHRFEQTFRDHFSVEDINHANFAVHCYSIGYHQKFHRLILIVNVDRATSFLHFQTVNIQNSAECHHERYYSCPEGFPGHSDLTLPDRMSFLTRQWDDAEGQGWYFENLK